MLLIQLSWCFTLSSTVSLPRSETFRCRRQEVVKLFQNLQLVQTLPNETSLLPARKLMAPVLRALPIWWKKQKNKATVKKRTSKLCSASSLPSLLQQVQQSKLSAVRWRLGRCIFIDRGMCFRNTGKQNFLRSLVATFVPRFCSILELVCRVWQQRNVSITARPRAALDWPFSVAVCEKVTSSK